MKTILVVIIPLLFFTACISSEKKMKGFDNVDAKKLTNNTRYLYTGNLTGSKSVKLTMENCQSSRVATREYEQRHADVINLVKNTTVNDNPIL